MKTSINRLEGLLFLLQTIIISWIQSCCSESIQTSFSQELSVDFVSDSCDWYGSSIDEDGSILPVYLRCSQGNVRWKYPKGGLRILVQPTGSHSDFQGCIRISRKSNANVKVSLEIPGPQLKPLYHSFDGKEVDLLRCFNSSGRKAALFVEAIPSSSLIHGDLFEIDYHLTPVEKENNMIPDQELNSKECQPCSDEELIHSYCTSDFLVRGSIDGITTNRALARSDITVKVQSILKESSVDKHLVSHGDQDKSIILHRPSKCGSTAGDPNVEYLLMGNWVLGNPVLKCAPKWSQWKHVRLRAIHDGSSHCRLG